MHTYPKWRNSTVYIFADEVIELSVFADEMLVYVENPRSLWKKKFMEVISEFKITDIR